MKPSHVVCCLLVLVSSVACSSGSEASSAATSSTSPAAKASTAGSDVAAARTGSSVAAPSSSAAAQGDQASLEAAFKKYAEMSNAQNWEGAWETFVPEHQAICSKSAYAKARDEEPDEQKPDVTVNRIESSTWAEALSIPESKATHPGRRFKASVSANGETVTAPFTGYWIDGAWRWSISDEFLPKCKAQPQ